MSDFKIIPGIKIFITFSMYVWRYILCACTASWATVRPFDSRADFRKKSF